MTLKVDVEECVVSYTAILLLLLTFSGTLEKVFLPGFETSLPPPKSQC